MSNPVDNRRVAVRLSGVKKMYKLGQIGGGTLQKDLQSWWARIRGKEDPNSIIGSQQRLSGETFLALRGIDLTVYQGEALGIIGGNGAGKSTLLKLLCRVTAPTEGEIDIYGRISSMLEVGTGFHGEMTGRENVYLNGAILGMTKAEIDAKMEQIIEFSEVRDFIDTPVKRYSSGMYVKLAFAVAAHLDSEILIMDEVLAVGDMAFQKKCLDRMRDAATKEGRTVLYVSHNMNTIRQLCDRCVVLDKGQIIFEGDVEEGIERYMGTKLTSSGVVELTSLKRAPDFAGHAVTMDAIWSEELENAVYPVGSKMKLRLSYTSSRAVVSANLRMMVHSADGTPVTMCTTSEGFELACGTQETVEIEVDTSRLAPGRYTLGTAIYEVDEMGHNTNLDALKEIYNFEIVSVPGFNHNMEWLPRYWGNTFCQPMKLRKITDGKSAE
ncbi:MAG: ABC transporter ATP-binding protein [Eubacteriales bacterium]